jgi:alpha-galactosidase
LRFIDPPRHARYKGDVNKPVISRDKGANGCSAELVGDRLTMSTGALRAIFRWNEGHLIGESVQSLRHEASWPLGGGAPDFEFPDECTEPSDGSLEIVEEPATPILEAYLRVTAATRLGSLEVRREFRLHPGCPLIRCRISLRGAATASWDETPPEASSLSNVESAATAREGAMRPTIMHRFFLPHHHLSLECAQFFDITDRRNTLVQVRHLRPYLRPFAIAGNVLVCRDAFEDRSLIVIKESPCSDTQLPEGGDDFVSRSNELQVIGVGLTPKDLDPSEWTPGYGFAFGAAPREEYEVLTSIRDYQRRQRIHRNDPDEMIMLNTWGDRSQDKAMSEAFVLEELAAGRRLGVTHFQLDHGWETTQDAAKTWPLDLKRIWDTPHFWNVHPTRFPRGLAPCIDAAKAAGIELCIWFNPSPEGSNEHWSDDANVLIGLYRTYGIRTFKIDGVRLPDKTAEINTRRMLDAVMEVTHDEAVFNLDVTAGRRFGYHYFNEYGNKFLENRYTDWSNYYPHWALRNLWMLSRYVPAQSLQIEFLNRWRNEEKYPAGDPLAPARVPFDYCFAVTMMGQPLAWFEASRLPEEAFATGALIRTYREHMSAIHAGCILPIGEEPSGTGWTGFHSSEERAGYVLVFRELNDRPAADLQLWGMDERNPRFSLVAGAAGAAATATQVPGRVRFELPGPFSFALFRYEVE